MKFRIRLSFKGVFVPLLLVFTHVSLSQIPVSSEKDKEDYNKIYNRGKYERVVAAELLKGTTTLVVIDKRAVEYGDSLKKAFSKHWRYTPYKFITPEEVSKYASRNGFSFFMFVRDEQFEGAGIDMHGNQVQQHDKPDLYFKSESIKHKTTKGISLGYPGDYFFSYAFIVAISSGEGIDDSSEENITSSLSIADYIFPLGKSELNYAEAGSLLDNEKETIPKLGLAIENFDNDLEYMGKEKREKKGIPLSEQCSLSYSGYTLNYKMDIIGFEDGKEPWKNKTLVIKDKMINESERALLAGLLGMDDGKVKFVSNVYIDSVKKAVYNDNLMIWDISENEYGGYGPDAISSVGGMDIIGLDIDRLKEVCKQKRPTIGFGETKKYSLLYKGNNEKFMLEIDNYSGNKDCCKNKSLFISKKICNNLGRIVLAGLLDMDSNKVKLIAENAIDSIRGKGDNPEILIMDEILDGTSGNYMITTVSGVELMDINNIEFDKICKYKHDNRTGSYDGKCELVYNNKSYTFKFHFVLFGENTKNNMRDKSLFIDSAYVDELGRGIIARILGMDDSKVKLVSKTTINSLIKGGDKNNLLFTDITLNEYNSYTIKTPDGTEVIGLSTNGLSRDFYTTMDLIGADKWSERKKFSIK